jgi:hypothetical protein
MKKLLAYTIIFLSMNIQAKGVGHYKVLPGTLHEKGSVEISILPYETKFSVQMVFSLKKKPYVPVPDKLLKGSKIYEFPIQFKSEEGYQYLETAKQIQIPKAILKFSRRGDLGNLKNAYFIQVLPTNKKTKIDIVYHSSLPSVGWAKIKITFISKIPVLNGYELEAEIIK